MIVPMNYSEVTYLTCTSGAVSTYKFIMNAVYDPNSSGAGIKPYLTDQMEMFYNVLVVTGCKAEITYSTQAACDVLIVMAPSIASITPPDASTQAGLPGAKSAVLTKDTGPITLVDYYDVAKQWGTTKEEILIDDAFQSTSSANPSAKSYLNLTAKPLDNTTTATVYLTVKLKLYVVWKQRIQQTEST